MGPTEERDSLLLRRGQPPAATGDEAAAPATLHVDPEDRPVLAEPPPRRWLAPLLVVAAMVAAYAGWRFLQAPPPPPPTVAVPAEAPPQPATEPAVKYPLPEALSGAKPDVSLPSLADSDAVLGSAIVALAGQTTLGDLLRPTEIVRRIVATVDNLPRSKVPRQLLPVAPPPGPFLVAAGTTIDPRNAARYAPYVRIVEAVDPKALATVYGAYYPLFQEQYRMLGYPKGNFNDRVIEAIDDLLAAPEPAAPPTLAQPKVLYEFADPALEARSSGQKMMLRLSAADAAKVKAKLRAIRQELAAAGPPEPARPAN